MDSSTFALFFDVVLTGTLLSLLLPLLGAALLLRRELFLGAAVAQTGSLGIAAWIAAGLGDGAGSLGAGMGAAIAAGVIGMRSGTPRGGGLQAGAAWLFLLGGSGAMLLLADAPHGMQAIEQLQLSSLLGATRGDVWVAGVGLVAVLAALLLRGRVLLLWALDPATATVHGHPVRTLDALAGATIGAALGFSIHATGLPFTFGATVLPVLAARELVGTLRGVLVMAPLLGAGAFVTAWWWADRADLPPGQCAVVLLAGAVAVARLAARLRSRPR
ncbi:MAG: metal ABC transporter permease [Planctomycetes bacterium]|nr:metal ABC transporter permease [Planctomycetota bacterium]